MTCRRSRITNWNKCSGCIRVWETRGGRFDSCIPDHCGDQPTGLILPLPACRPVARLPPSDGGDRECKSRQADSH